MLSAKFVSISKAPSLCACGCSVTWHPVTRPPAACWLTPVSFNALCQSPTVTWHTGCWAVAKVTIAASEWSAVSHWRTKPRLCGSSCWLVPLDRFATRWHHGCSTVNKVRIYSCFVYVVNCYSLYVACLARFSSIMSFWRKHAVSWQLHIMCEISKIRTVSIWVTGCGCEIFAMQRF
jgi:hypothetical protein